MTNVRKLVSRNKREGWYVGHPSGEAMRVSDTDWFSSDDRPRGKWCEMFKDDIRRSRKKLITLLGEGSHE